MGTLQQRLARGEASAYAELYDACADRVGHYLAVKLGSWADAEDAMQETFLRLARTRKRLAGIENLNALVFTIARNEAARLAAKRSRRQERQQSLGGEELFCSADGNGETLRETAETVAAALQQLPPDLRELVELKTYGELTFEQISQVTGVAQGTVASRYRSALEKMQSWFARVSR